jgi:hypothetical protein
LTSGVFRNALETILYAVSLKSGAEFCTGGNMKKFAVGILLTSTLALSTIAGGQDSSVTFRMKSISFTLNP